MPGQPLIYSTSKNFMDYFGINSADDLPKIREVLSEQMIEPTAMNQLNFEDEIEFAEKEIDLIKKDEVYIQKEDENAILSVAENGQLIEKAEDDEPDQS